MHIITYIYMATKLAIKDVTCTKTTVARIGSFDSLDSRPFALKRTGKPRK